MVALVRSPTSNWSAIVFLRGSRKPSRKPNLHVIFIAESYLSYCCRCCAPTVSDIPYTLSTHTCILASVSHIHFREPSTTICLPYATWEHPWCLSPISSEAHRPGQPPDPHREDSPAILCWPSPWEEGQGWWLCYPATSSLHDPVSPLESSVFVVSG